MALLILFVIAIIITIVVTPFVAMAKASNAERRVKDLSLQLGRLEKRLRQFTDSAERSPRVEQPVVAARAEKHIAPAENARVAAPTPPAPVVQAPKEEPADVLEPELPKPTDTFNEDDFYPNPTPPPLPSRQPPAESAPEPVFAPAPEFEPEAAFAPEPPPAPASAPAPARAPFPASKPAPKFALKSVHKPARAQAPAAKPFDWEQFMGAKMFAWVGGLALFLGVAFFVKYSFEHNLIPPALRVAIGFLTGTGLLAGGVAMKRKETAVTSHTLCSTGILILYGVTFACNHIYKFPAFGTGPSFFLMTLITVTAFLLAVRLDALVVAILGIAGGFLTPALFSTGKDAPLALFGYIALLDIGLLTVALRQRWNSLPVLGAIGTVLMELGWITKFFVPEKYFAGHKALIAMTVLFGFQALFLAATAWANRSEERGRNFSGPALALGLAALLGSFFFLSFESIGHQPVMLFGYLLLVDAGLILLVFTDERLAMVEACAGLAAFGFLTAWTRLYLGPTHLYAALGAYLVFSLLHLGAKVLISRTLAAKVPWIFHLLPVLAIPFYFLCFQSIGQHPVLFFGSVLVISVALLAVGLLEKDFAPTEGIIGLATFLLLGIWAFNNLTSSFLHIALIAYLVFALLRLAAPVLMKRKHGNGVPWAVHVLPMLALPFYLLWFQTVAQHPALFFGSVFVVSLALLAAGLLEKDFAPAEGAIGIAAFLLLGIWAGNNLTSAHLYVALAVYLIFALRHLAAPVLIKRKQGIGTPWALCVLPMLALPFYLLSFQTVAQHPVLFFGSVFLVSLALLAAGLLEKEFAPAEGLAGIATFLLLGIWTGNNLTDAHLYVALALYFIFALFHSAAPVVIHKLRGTVLPWWCNAFPALALLLVMMPIFKLPELTILVWPLVLVIDVLAIILSVVTAALLPILVVLVLTLVAVGAWIFRIPADLTGLPTSLFMLGGFAVFFIVAATFASRKLMKTLTESGKIPGLAGSVFGDAGNPENLAVQVPVLSAALPFLLLIMLTLRLPLVNPSPVFGLALLLVVLLLGMTKIMSIDALAAVGLASVIGLEHAWHFHNFNPAHATLPLAWYVIFYSAFTVFPFLFHRHFAKSAVPWATAALAGPLHFYLLREVIPAAWPAMAGKMGLLPAALSIPALLGVVGILKRTPGDSPARNSQLAWFGGIALFFITLIFPVQFDRQWITIGWALEGAALCWLFQRVPHKGLPLVGTGLLVTAFVRLALNPAVLEYQEKTATPILNWYLYAYGVTAACLFAGAWFLAPPRNKVLGSNVPPIFQGLGTVLIFLLVNIEIADFFTIPGAQSLTFEFSGNFARDMSYSIAWAFFALLMLVVGIRKRLAPVRYASIGLLLVTLLKLFLHDLSQLDQLYRIVAFIVVAVIAIFASFLYQRFLGSVEKNNETPTIPPVS